MNRKPILIGLAVLILIIGFFAVRAMRDDSVSTDTNTGNTSGQNDTIPTVAAGEIKYVDPGERFTFIYPNTFKVTGPTNARTTQWRSNATTSGYLLASLTIPKSYMPNTNFSDAKLTVGVSNTPAELSGTGCPSGVNIADVPGGATAVTIHGQTFTKLMSNNAGAGNFYETTSYFTVRDGDCYAIEYTIHSTNINNYPASSGVTEFDKAKVRQVLENIVKSFVFTINSD